MRVNAGTARSFERTARRSDLDDALAISDAYSDEKDSRRSVCRRRLMASGSAGILAASRVKKK